MVWSYKELCATPDKQHLQAETTRFGMICSHFYRLQEIRFQPLKSDEIVFVCSKCLSVWYVDDGIFMSPEKTLIDKLF